ncbi:relaxase/mobilization nuclease domain-containing protein [Streptomyces sp. H39-C1]|uniref:relaxase/mobilization nuclease domain-containing protein n=1 Tax=Streptomyces sp. H39-C1 TaxID=3004355 RepID=UPI0022AE6ED6|nr:relaxase/mobilization nuclease domain-containing protein [Streptomyces sp. H39-C1]MCZ4096130.1 relaxase/mobilization nuclease domain-containing protein [Streptomyces sp. H39-C1]
MIPHITTGSGGTKRLVHYLFGPGEHNEHTDQHLVASWNNFAPDPGPQPDPATEAKLAAQLDLPVNALPQGQRPTETNWHCSVRTAPTDRLLTDDEWADIARRVVAAAGIAPDGDTKACRWIAVRHAPDHIHIAATLVRQDGRVARRSYDRKAVQAACRTIEEDYGLRQLHPGDGTAPQRATSPEHFKAERLGRTQTARDELREAVRQAKAAARDEAHFFTLLEGTGMKVRPRQAPSGDITGYSVAHPSDTNAAGEPIYYSGSKLSPDLSLPEIRKHLAAQDQAAPTADPWHAAADAARHTLAVLDSDDDAGAQAHLAAFGELLDTTTFAAPTVNQAELRAAAKAFHRATRSTIRAEHQQAAALRRAAKDLIYTATSGQDGTGLAVLLSIAILITRAAMHWHQVRDHQQQQAAAQQALAHLTTAYEQTARPTLTALARSAPRADATRRYEAALRQAIPEHADHILADPAWAALTATLAQTEKTGDNPRRTLQDAAEQRELTTAQSPAEVLHWRITATTSKRQQAAKARSTGLIAPARSTGLIAPAPAAPPAPLPAPIPPTPQQRR